MLVRFSKSRVVLAIYGQSCVGKSTLAEELGKRWASPVRHCGNLVKTYARAAGIQAELLPLGSHRKIDTETRRIAQQSKGLLIIEGIYLDIVLRDMPHVRLLQLICADRTRELRFHERSAAASSLISTLRQRDAETAGLRRNLYGSEEIAAPAWMVLDTTTIAAAEMESPIRARLERELCDD